jgi:Uma2 family endonuclease
MSLVHEPADVTTVALLTWDEFLDLPYETRNTDLIDGKLVVNSPNFDHELVVQNLYAALRAWRAAIGSWPGTAITQQPVKVNERRGYQPDLALYRAEQVTTDERGKRVVSGVPCIVVEVFSPSTRRFDLLRKRADYERLGAAEVWFIDPDERNVLIERRDAPGGPFRTYELEPDGLLTTAELPGFAIAVAALFVDD